MHDLGFVSAILADYTFEEVIKIAKEEKFKCVEMMCWPKGQAERRYAGVTHIDVDHLDQSTIASIHQTLTEADIYISALGYYPNPLDPDDDKASFYRAHIKKVIAAAKQLGITKVNTFIGRNPSLNIDDNIKLFKIKMFLQLHKKLFTNFEIVIETIFRILCIKNFFIIKFLNFKNGF
ncbi:MAG TPA: TIM barrel protein [Saprospiraceae bacterium]|nr:TIM barrel protein [Saprospiraceae bacterium]